MDNNQKHQKYSPVEQLQHKPGPEEFFIVGIGASAGGVAALQEFFRNVPEKSGAAYVVILHLSPDYDSQLTAVLQRETIIPVIQVTQNVIILPDHIYVIPPDQHLVIKGESIAVSMNTAIEERRAPVDIFFRSLADEQGPRAIAVILSGTGANGSMGLKRVKERGGACFVQNPREAEFNEMARHAISTGLVDEVLPVAEIPAKIIKYKSGLTTAVIADEGENPNDAQQESLRDIFTQIRVRTGHDFSNYKRPTLLRRLERRANIRNMKDLPEYAKLLHDDPQEIDFLLKDLLISVTNFFRDSKAFEYLETDVLPLIFNGKNNRDTVRIWVAGCATGEEAYSIAMLCAEKTIGLIDSPKVQIFATDLDESSIFTAREGRYTINDAADVSPERLRRFFNLEGDHYRIRREVRETVLFAQHNFLKDPPFSHLDLISCRNVMIYLNQVAQDRVIETFHFSLNPGSFLFLGSSESVDGGTDLYASYNRENHIFRSRQVGPRTYPIPESLPMLYFDEIKKPSSLSNQETKNLPRISFGDLHQQLLEQYAPPSVVVNEEYEILHLTDGAGKYLQIGGGEISQNLLKLVKPEIRLELRSALYRAVQRQTPVEARGVKIATGDNTEIVNIHVRPVLRAGDTARGFILIIFEPSAIEGKMDILLSSDEPVAMQLEEELIKVKMQLRAANEQHDFQAEEMKAANEELQAINEELRSAAEELETSKEEMQSINEELRTVNQELKVKIEETSIASNNLQNLINSTDIGTIFLDRRMKVAFFTPAIGTLFNLIPADYGRPLSDITHRLEYTDLLKDAELVLEKLNTVEKEVKTISGRIYLLRITPYRTNEDRIKGVVITFIDFTERRHAEETLRKKDELTQRATDKYMQLFNSIDTGFCIIEVLFTENEQPYDYRFIEANKAFSKQTGLEEVVGKTILELVPDYETYWLETYGRIAKTGQPERFHNAAKSLGFNYEVYAFRVDDVTAGPHQVAILFNDITERVRDEQFKTFLLQLSDAIRPLNNAISIQKVAMELLGVQMEVDCAFFLELSPDQDTSTVITGFSRNLPTLTGSFRLSDFKSHFTDKLLSGKNLIINNLDELSTDDRIRKQLLELNFRAGIGIPLVKENKLLAILVVQQSTPRQWARHEEALLEEVAQRTWLTVERAQLEQQKEDFLSIASHELKTPVTSIQAYGELLEETFEELHDLESASVLRKMNAQVSRLNALISDLLDTTKISQGQLTLETEDFNLFELLQQLTQELQQLTKKHQLLLTGDQSLIINADKKKIEQVISNLVLNAIKYSPEGGPVFIHSEMTGEDVKISVSDNGIGIASDVRDKIFNRFFRIQNPRLNTMPGMGLGLFISAGIVERHGGSIGVTDNAEKGSTFYFILPGKP